PYAKLSGDAYNDNSGSKAPPGYSRVADWEKILKGKGVSDADIKRYHDSGFYAAVYKNEKTGETVIAYRGTQPSSGTDWEQDKDARFWKLGEPVPTQYEAAGRLATLIGKDEGRNLTLTGHSLGGGLASYAGGLTGANAVTFNGARNPLS